MVRRRVAVARMLIGKVAIGRAPMASVRGEVASKRKGRRTITLITLGKGKMGKTSGTKGNTGGGVVGASKTILVAAPAPAPNLGGARGTLSEEKS